MDFMAQPITIFVLSCFRMDEEGYNEQLHLEKPAYNADLTRSLYELQQSGKLCDVILHCVDGAVTGMTEIQKSISRNLYSPYVEIQSLSKVTHHSAISCSW